MMDTLVGLLILFPIVIGSICLLVKHHKVRASIVILTASVLIFSALVLLSRGSFPIKYSPAPTWDLDILILGYVILAFFLFVSIKDFVQRGMSRHNVLAIWLTLAAGIPLAIFEFFQAPHAPVEVKPALFMDHLSLVMCFIISILFAQILGVEFAWYHR